MKESVRIKEFRVGNYVVGDHPWSLGKVIETTSTGFPPGGNVGVEFKNQFSGKYIKRTSIDNLRPIPLTEKLIERGLCEDFRRVDRKDGRIEFEIPCEVLPGVYGVRNWSLLEDEEDKNKWWLSAGTGSYITLVKSLHHLQNLFFDLEGVELSIYDDQIDGLIKSKELWKKIKD